MAAVSAEAARGGSFGPFALNAQAPDEGNMHTLLHWATDAQKQKYLRPLCDGKIRSCFAMTEPEVAGSDPTLIQTKAVRDGDDWVINGHKWFISGARGARFAIAFDDALIDASDDDAVLNDCVSLHQKKRASTDGMRTTVCRLSDMAVEIRLRGSADNPLATPAASIDWDLTLTIDVSGGTPKWTLKGTHNNFPAYELFVNGQKIHGHSPGDPPFALSDVLTLIDNPFTDVSVSESGELQ